MFDGIFDLFHNHYSAGCTVAEFRDSAEYGGVEITFKTAVNFKNLVIYTRDGCHMCGTRYGDVCLYADGTVIGCTPGDLRVSDGLPIKFNDFNHHESDITATEFRLVWENNQCAQIAELYFYYCEGQCYNNCVYEYRN